MLPVWTFWPFFFDDIPFTLLFLLSPQLTFRWSLNLDVTEAARNSILKANAEPPTRAQQIKERERERTKEPKACAGFFGFPLPNQKRRCSWNLCNFQYLSSRQLLPVLVSLLTERCVVYCSQALFIQLKKTSLNLFCLILCIFIF